MKLFQRKRVAPKGFNLIELTMILLIISLLAAFATVSFGNTGEKRDATLVQSSQAALQAIVSQGSVRMDTRPDQLPPNAVLIAVQASIGQSNNGNTGVRFTNSGNQYVLNIDNSQRSAIFDISSSGDVRLIGLNNFPNYTVDRTNAAWTIRKAP